MRPVSRARADGDLRRLFRAPLSEFHWVSIETGTCAPGTPDSNYCCRGAEGWVEFKATAGWAVPLRPAQIAWLDRRGRAGGRGVVAVRRRTADADELWLLDGSAARQLRAGGLRGSQALGAWGGGPTGWDWSSVAQLLTGNA